jgi:cytidine deaminase
VDSDKLFPPCGACRQVLAEFNPAMEVLYANRAQICRSNLESLLPQAFTLKS